MAKTPIAPKEERAALGVGLMFLAVTCFTGIDSSAKWLILAGIPVLQVVFVRYAVHFVLGLALFLPREGLGVLRSKTPKLQILRSFCLLMMSILNFQALEFLPLTVATTILFAGPIVVTLMAIPLLGEKVGARRLIAVAVGFLGVIVVMQPWGAAFHPAVFLTFGAVLCAGGYFIITRKIAGTESPATSQLWSSGLSAAVFLPVALQVWVWPDTITGYLVMGLIGLVGGAGHFAATVAHRFAEASLLAPVIYFQILSAAIIGVLVFDTWPTLWTLVGALIIIGSGIYIWHRERQLGKAPRVPD
ncbi:MAG: DMT family transporter [Mangrovicoccus sp.]